MHHHTSYNKVSEGVGIITTPEFAISAAIVAHNADHFVHIGSDLHAACQANEGAISLSPINKSVWLSGWLVVELLEPGVGDVDGALRAVHASTERVIRHLMGSHLVLLITTDAVWVDAWHLVPVHDFEKWLASAGGHASWNTIGRQAVDPDDLICHLDTTIFSRWTQGVATEHSWHLTYKIENVKCHIVFWLVFCEIVAYLAQKLCSSVGSSPLRAWLPWMQMKACYLWRTYLFLYDYININ